MKRIALEGLRSRLPEVLADLKAGECVIVEEDRDLRLTRAARAEGSGSATPERARRLSLALRPVMRLPLVPS
jgi:hypothetical protein